MLKLFYMRMQVNVFSLCSPHFLYYMTVQYIRHTTFYTSLTIIQIIALSLYTSTNVDSVSSLGVTYNTNVSQYDWFGLVVVSIDSTLK